MLATSTAICNAVLFTDVTSDFVAAKNNPNPADSVNLPISTSTPFSAPIFLNCVESIITFNTLRVAFCKSPNGSVTPVAFAIDFDDPPGIIKSFPACIEFTGVDCPPPQSVIINPLNPHSPLGISVHKS